jgi:hypothetical protein
MLSIAGDLWGAPMVTARIFKITVHRTLNYFEETMDSSSPWSQTLHLYDTLMALRGARMATTRLEQSNNDYNINPMKDSATVLVYPE